MDKLQKNWKEFIKRFEKEKKEIKKESTELTEKPKTKKERYYQKERDDFMQQVYHYKNLYKMEKELRLKDAEKIRELKDKLRELKKGSK